jgi:2-hydroxychromene-2-carboxylate isomerase
MARLALAADRQGAFEAASARLETTPFVPTPAYAADLARSLGIDPERLIADARSPEITSALLETDDLARALGIRGTPALVIGRTVTRREIRPGDLDRLIAGEAELGPPPC